MWSWIPLFGKHIDALNEVPFRPLQQASNRSVRVLRSIVLIIVSATLAFSLPWMAETFFAHWTRVQDHRDLLVVSEMAIAILIFMFLNFLREKVEDLKLARVAKDAGLTHFVTEHDRGTNTAIGPVKFRHSYERPVLMIVGTGRRTFVDPEENSHHVLRKCREAKILLLSPCSEETQMRANTPRASITMIGDWTEHDRKAIQFLQSLRRMEKNIKLKLIPASPPIHLLILGDHLWVRHCHPMRAVRPLPDYVFRRTSNNHGLYTLFHQYFVSSWESPAIPEYDLERDELVYRSSAGSEQRRVSFIWKGPGRSGTGHHVR